MALAAMPLDLAGLLFLIGISMLAIGILAYVRDPGQSALQGMPVIGNWLANKYVGLINSLLSSITAFMHAAEGDLATTIHTITYWIETPFYAVRDLLRQAESMAKSDWDTLNGGITSAVAQARSWVDHLSSGVAAALAYITSQLHVQAASIVHVEGEAHAWVGSLSQSVSNALGWVTSQLHVQAASIVHVEGEAHAWVSGLSNNVAAALDWVTSQLHAQAASIVHVEGEARAWADDAVNVAAAHADAVGQAAIATAVSGAMARAIPLIQTVAQDIDTYKSNCGEPLCDGLLGAAKDLSALEGLIGDGLLVALIMAAISDPQGTARAVEPVLSDIIEPVYDGVKAAL